VKHRDPLADPEQLIRRIYSYVAYMVGEGTDAEDITSATIERALRYRPSYDPRRGSPVAWLLGIARNCIADRHHEQLTGSDEELDELEAPEGSLDHVDRLAVQAAVGKLSPRDRELIALRYGADLSARQIGAELGLRANAVEVALHRAHTRLHALLAEDFAREAPVDAS
jgi:RNA polymerase sigma-70 factor, ECF subfamily